MMVTYLHRMLQWGRIVDSIEGSGSSKGGREGSGRDKAAAAGQETWKSAVYICVICLTFHSLESWVAISVWRPILAEAKSLFIKR